MRKAIHLTMTGGKSPRQHMWEAIRSLSRDPKGLTTYNVSRLSGQEDQAVSSYLRDLKKAGIVERVEVLVQRDARWKLLADEGAEAPRVNKKGERVPPSAVENIWRTLRILGEMSAAEAAEHASVNGVTMTELAARTYLQGLTLAGYVTRTDGTPGKPARYHLVRQRYSGPQHPVYQRSTFEQVYDPNLDQVVWTKDIPDCPELAGLRLEKACLEKALADLLAAAKPIERLAGRMVAQFHPDDSERAEGIEALRLFNYLAREVSA
ncbi:MarR family transcriptional regulator [Pseudomonas pseudonitroreducens]|uniref:MarR family transcriptional regulator n=1 Tax=Pseudomonas pseudonitroreducens TaxID=2892326 RepID=UPI001F2FA30C|nr:MarR family transcriptional regulator [Pseudomonas pseudonitroreducens]